MSALLDVTLPVFLVIGFGHLAVWRLGFSDTAADALMKFAQNFAIPVLLFSAISSLDLGRSFQPALLVSYYTGSAFVFVTGALGARYLFGRDLQDAVVIGFCALFANSVLLGLSITERAYGAEALGPNFAIVAIHAPFCYLLGITTMEVIRNRGGGAGATAGKVARAMFRNPLMIGIGLGFAVNLGQIPLPVVLTDATALVTRAALPTSLFALGGLLVRYRPEGDLRLVLWIGVLSLAVHPTIAWVMSTQVFGLPHGMVRSATITAAMAPGVNTYIFASMYGRAQRVAATTVLMATAASILTATFWLTAVN